MKKLTIITLILTIIIMAGGVYWYKFRPPENTPVQSENVAVDPSPTLSLPERFVAAFYAAELPNLKLPAKPPIITGDPEADEHIRTLAEQAGYQQQKLPIEAPGDVQGVSLQSTAAADWRSLQAAARAEGVYLALVSGYRSVENQRLIFTTELRDRAIVANKRGFNAAEIKTGKADGIIANILKEYSIPGYSKHHTGYAVDITDSASDKPFEMFAQSPAYRWVKQSNYANIRQFGFIPSYPEGVSSQGPSPEPWEYVWVGRSAALAI